MSVRPQAPGTQVLPIAPTLTDGSGSATGSTTAELSVTTDQPGILYAIVSTVNVKPSVAQVMAGEDSTGDLAAARASERVTLVGAQSISVDGLADATTYYPYFMQANDRFLSSEVVAGASFTTGTAIVAPVKTGNPTISGTPEVGQTLTATHGTYTGTVTGYSGQWFSGASPIALATALSYTPQDADLGNEITYDESAYNTNPMHSSATGTSNALGPVTAPSDTTAPTITSADPSGSYVEGDAIGGTLTADETVTWAVTGTDASAVTLDTDTGVWSLADEVGTFDFSFVATDTAGNPSDPQVIEIEITAASMSAPSLAFDSADGWTTGQNPPQFAITLPSDGSVEVGDWYRIIYGTDAGLAGATDAPWHQITSDDVLNETVGMSYDWGVSTLPAGQTYFAAQFGRGADEADITLTSPLSNIISDTIAAAELSTTLDPANASTHVTVGTGTFGANLRVSNGIDGGAQSVRTTTQVPVGGKYYCEMTVTALHASGHVMLGASDGTFAFASTFGTEPPVAGKGAGLAHNGFIYPSTTGLGVGLAAGMILQCCIKRTGSSTIRLWIGHNDTWVGDPSAETGGETVTLTDTNCYGFVGVNDSVDEIDINFGQAAFTYPEPTGATPWA